MSIGVLVGKAYSYKRLWFVAIIVFLVVTATAFCVFFSDLFSLFGVSSSRDRSLPPEITNSYVQPTKVRPGNTMLVSAEIKDGYGISDVMADMGGIETIPLFLQNGTIYNGLWQNNWLVHDTLPIEYNTTIAATNALGESSVEIVGWSDPDESSWTVGSGGNVWNGNVTVLIQTIVRSTEYVELRQYVDDYVSYWRFDEKHGNLAA